MVEAKKYWGAVDLSQIEGYDELSEREKNAVKLALDGLADWQTQGKPPKEIRVALTPDNPFDMKAYANVLHTLGVNISDSLKKAEDGSVTFLPAPYDEETLERPSYSDIFNDFFGHRES